MRGWQHRGKAAFTERIRMAINAANAWSIRLSYRRLPNDDKQADGETPPSEPV